MPTRYDDATFETWDCTPETCECGSPSAHTLYRNPDNLSLKTQMCDLCFSAMIAKNNLS